MTYGHLNFLLPSVPDFFRGGWCCWRTSSLYCRSRRVAGPPSITFKRRPALTHLEFFRNDSSDWMQECKKRGLRLSWCCLKLQHCGFQAGVSRPSLFSPVSLLIVSGGQRTYFPCSFQGRDYSCHLPGNASWPCRLILLLFFFESIEAEIENLKTRFLFYHLTALSLQDVPALDHWVNQEWNVASRIGMEDWLDANQDEESKCRMKCLGNIVVPCQAQMGVAVLSHVLKLALGP